jgi:Uma2 family endonuclease
MLTAPVSKEKIWTDRDLEALPKDGYKRELIDGKIIMSPVHANHGIICIRLASLLFHFVARRKLGEVLDSSTGFRLSQKVLLSPDISFVSKATLKKIFAGPDKFFTGAPDLAIEVLSPSDRMKEVYRKIDLYFEHGTRMAWLIDWKKEQIHIYTTDQIEALTRPQDVLSGSTVLPGFKCRLNRIFHG